MIATVTVSKQQRSDRWEDGDQQIALVMSTNSATTLTATNQWRLFYSLKHYLNTSSLGDTSQEYVKRLNGLTYTHTHHGMPGGTSTWRLLPMKRTYTRHVYSHSGVQKSWFRKLSKAKFGTIANSWGEIRKHIKSKYLALNVFKNIIIHTGE